MPVMKEKAEMIPQKGTRCTTAYHFDTSFNASIVLPPKSLSLFRPCSLHRFQALILGVLFVGSYMETSVISSGTPQAPMSKGF